jgi:glycosyltransferase involved in cell wall biosynthesis
VVTEVGDSALLVGDTGKTVPPGDSAALASALDKLIDLPEGERRELGQKARKRIRDEYTIEKLVERTQKALLNLINPSTSPV